MSTEKNKAAVRRLFDEVWNAGDEFAIDDIFDRSFLYAEEPVIGPTRVSGMSAPSLRHEVRVNRSVFPDLKFEIRTMVTDDNSVAAAWTASGTHQGELRLGFNRATNGSTVPPTGKSVKATGVTICFVVDGKIKSMNNYWAPLSLLQQLALVGDSADPAEFLAYLSDSSSSPFGLP